MKNSIRKQAKKHGAAAFENMLKSALSDMREYSTDKIVSLINGNPQNGSYLPNGIEITDIDFTSICPDEKNIMEIVNFRIGNKG